MKKFLLLLLVAAGLSAGVSAARADAAFIYSPYEDPLAPRDEDGLLHQMATPVPTDLAPRSTFRFDYYLASPRALISDPAYVGALQDALRRHGYYCGPTDGVYSDDVRAAIARMQKNYSFRVTGTLTLAVRRGLHLP
jgi:peptidoglycan hydrolase-like protein with peptidoglycan-binding domain